MPAPAQNMGQPKPTEEPKLSPAELKKKVKAEKQARRAAQKEEQHGDGVAGSYSSGVHGGQQGQNQAPALPQGQSSKQPQSQQRQVQQQKQGKQGGQEGRKHHETTSSQPQALPVRRRPSQSGAVKEAPRKEKKQVELFGHLYSQPRRHTIEGAAKDVHPAVLALGLQISSYEICGSSARCVAMLLAFKEVIQAYSTPTGASIRYLASHHLSPQIDFLKSCRPISESMGNAIRYLKKMVVENDPSMPEQEAKDYFCDEIDRFIRERITVTDQAIAASACLQIEDGSVILTYAKSSIVEKTILQAHDNGVRFRVIVVDSRPLFEGKNLATSLLNAGLQVEFVPFSGIAHAVQEATIVLLGAHSMLSNGTLQSRVGTASVAMQAHKANVPVIVCCESVKFSGKVALDSIGRNEVAPAEELFTPLASAPAPQLPNVTDDGDNPQSDLLNDRKENPNLHVLNLMYDLTPAEYIRMVICEYGSVPPSSVPVVHRLANEGM